jgi:hypothetical protein
LVMLAVSIDRSFLSPLSSWLLSVAFPRHTQQFQNITVDMQACLIPLCFKSSAQESYRRIPSFIS